MESHGREKLRKLKVDTNRKFTIVRFQYSSFKSIASSVIYEILIFVNMYYFKIPQDLSLCT